MITTGFTQTDAFSGFYELTRATKKAGWKFKASSNGTTKVSNSDPAADQWGAGTVSNTGAAAASIAAPTQGRATVTGLTGIVAADKGKFLLIAGAATGANNNQHQIEEILSATSVRIDARNFAVASDANNGALTWSILDPLGQGYLNTAFVMTTIAWWCAQGPSILKIPITTASTGTFIRGENVVQATTNAEGELLGYTYYNNTGWLVISPRVRGSGGGVHGWATSNVITGGRSGATVSQNGTALDYVYEVVFAKPANLATIQILLGQFNTVADSAEMFSFCATQAGCTATVHPGGGGTGNAFGAHAWVAWGTNSTPTFGSTINVSTMTLDCSNLVCVDAIPEQNYTADGSWTVFFMGHASGGAAIGGTFYSFQRLNDTEEGEISPYVSLVPPASKTLYGQGRTSAGGVAGVNTRSAGSSQSWASIWAAFFGAGTAFVALAGWRGRGLAIETFTELEMAILMTIQGTNAFFQYGPGSTVARVQSTANLMTKVREKMWVVAAVSPFVFVKGSFRWMFWVTGDQVTDTYGNNQEWVQLATANDTIFTSNSVMILGPHDGIPWSVHAGTN
jgi:hypothetical protein